MDRRGKREINKNIKSLHNIDRLKEDIKKQKNIGSVKILYTCPKDSPLTQSTRILKN